MVLVVPAPIRPSGPIHDGAPGRAGTGREVLTLLRGDVSERPNFDPGLAGGLRAWLEDAAYHAASERGEQTGRLMLGSRQLLGAPPEREAAAPSRRLVGRLVHVLFRLLVHGVDITHPLDDALEAVRAAGDASRVEEIESLSATTRDGLAGTLAEHVANLSHLVPRFAPGWMPRTDDYVAIPLAGGRVVLHGVFDLLVGVPQAGTASLCALGLSTGGPWARERRSLHFLSLLQTLRSGTPPFRVALLESATGRYGVEDIREDHLRAMAAHIAAWLAHGETLHE